MRVAFWLLALAALAAANSWDGPWVEEEELEEPYDDERSDVTNEPDESPRTRREIYERTEQDIYEEDPYEHVIVKRCCDVPRRVRRSAEHVRVPRQVHQYEVHESTDESSYPSPPYEEMLAASAEHYHRTYAAPGAPASARYLNPDVSSGFVGVRPVPSIKHVAPVNTQAGFVPSPVAYAKPPSNYVYASQTVPPVNHASSLPNVYEAPKPAALPHGSVNVNPQPSVVSDIPASPVQYVELPNVPPVAVSVGSELPAAVPGGPVTPVSRLAAGDQLSAAAGHAHQHQQHRKRVRGHVAAGGNNKHAGHHATHGGKSVKGFQQHHHVDKGGKGHKTDEHHRKEFEEAAGKKKKHHDHADHKGGHEEQAHGQRGAKFDEKKGHKKGHKTKGYHNKYHKDEFHKEHKFYDDFHKSGEHHRYGKFHAKHASNESGKKKAHHVNAGHDYVERGKKGYSNKGHLDADHKGHKGKHGHEEHHETHEKHGKKGGSEGGKEWGYEKKA